MIAKFLWSLLVAVAAMCPLTQWLMSGYPLLTHAVEGVCLTLICILIVMLSVLYVWRMLDMLCVKVSSAKYEETYAEVVSCRLDPTRGVIIDVRRNAEIFPAVLNPIYWNLLPSLATSNEAGTEAPILLNPINAVKTNGEPDSLVALTNGSKVIGYGSRVSYLGSTYLLTAAHVWHGFSAEMYMVKSGRQVKLDTGKYPVKFGSMNERVEFVMVEIPLPLWSVLAVKAAKLAPMGKTSIVTAYGGENPSKMGCSSSRAVNGEYVGTISHSCTTSGGWSGTPLYSKGTVVGVHVGVEKIGKLNRAVNAGLLLSLGKETEFSEVSLNEIDENEVADRDYPFLDVEISGKKVLLGKGEFAITDPVKVKAFVKEKEQSGGMLWSELEFDDVDHYYDTLESIDDHLNCPGAENVKRSPPSKILAVTNGSIPVAPPVKESVLVIPGRACPLPSLADRVLNLENLVNQQTTLISNMLLNTSQNLKGTVGPKEVVTPSCDPSSSKPQDSSPLKHRKVRRKRSKGSSPSIPNPVQEPVSEVKPGTNAKSRRRSRRSAKAVSTQPPPQASH